MEIMEEDIIPKGKRGVVYLGDMVEVFGNLPDNSIDLIITDPPFGIGFDSNKHYNDEFDYVSENIDTWFSVMHNKLKPYRHIYVFIPSKHSDVWKSAFKKYFRWMNDLIIPVHPTNVYDAKNFSISHQMVLYGVKFPKDGKYGLIRNLNRVNYQKTSPQWLRDGRNKNPNEYTYKYHTIFPSTIKANYRNNASKKTAHPSEKTIELLSILIRLSSNPDEIVADPFAGSGNTLISAHKTGRRYIGAEIDPKWYNVILDKIKNVKKEFTLREYTLVEK